ncbi:hypothetical protein BH09DEP1_BH09DEP1_6380 [soil metagenome]
MFKKFLLCLLGTRALLAMEQLPATLHRFPELPDDLKVTVLSKLFEHEKDPQKAMLSVLPFLRTSKKYYESANFFSMLMQQVRHICFPQEREGCGVSPVSDNVDPMLKSKVAKLLKDLDELCVQAGMPTFTAQCDADAAREHYLPGLKVASWVNSRASKQALRQELAAGAQKKEWANNYFYDICHEAPLEQLQILLAAGVDVNYRAVRNHSFSSSDACGGEPDVTHVTWSRTPVIKICNTRGIKEIYSRLSFLLSWGADVNSVDENGATALSHFISLSGMRMQAYGDNSDLRPRIAKLLAAHGANLLHVNQNGNTLFSEAGDNYLQLTQMRLNSEAD